MAKIFLISINIIIVFALKIFFGGDVKVEQKMQDTIRPGETLNVTLEITKGDREGFAKWQQSLPEGFIASSVEMNGATFSFKNQEIKIIWMELPTTETFTIQYNIETSETVTGEHNLSGKFSFIEENERRDINSELFILTIDENAMADNSNKQKVDVVETPEPATELVDNSEDAADLVTQAITEVNIPVNNIAKKTSSNNTNTVKTKATENDLVSITREVKHLGEGNYEVSLIIEKTSLSSFGKVEDYLPPNYTASAIESEEGIFSFNNNVMKILWMTLPEKESFEVKYAVQTTSDELDSATIHGVFSYLNVDQSVQNKLAPTKFRNFLASPILADVTETEGSSDEDSASVNLVENIDNTSASENTSDDNSSNGNRSNENLVQKITNIPTPETDVAYRVQIAASHKEVDQKYFAERHNVTESVTIDFHETWYKYTIGSFPVYKQARDKRNEVWAENNKINDAFVTAYNSGERISVQEALMISKQKWFK